MRSALLFFLLASWLAAATAEACLSPTPIRAVVRSHLPEVRGCYEHALVGRPDLRGRIVVRFTITGSGAVTEASATSDTIGDPSLALCIEAAVRTWVFPAVPGGGTVRVSYPFQLEPAR